MVVASQSYRTEFPRKEITGGFNDWLDQDFCRDSPRSFRWLDLRLRADTLPAKDTWLQSSDDRARLPALWTGRGLWGTTGKPGG